MRLGIVISVRSKPAASRGAHEGACAERGGSRVWVERPEARQKRSCRFSGAISSGHNSHFIYVLLALSAVRLPLGRNPERLPETSLPRRENHRGVANDTVFLSAHGRRGKAGPTN